MASGIVTLSEPFLADMGKMNGGEPHSWVAATLIVIDEAKKTRKLDDLM